MRPFVSQSHLSLGLTYTHSGAKLLHFGLTKILVIMAKKFVLKITSEVQFCKALKIPGEILDSYETRTFLVSDWLPEF